MESGRSVEAPTHVRLFPRRLGLLAFYSVLVLAVPVGWLATMLDDQYPGSPIVARAFAGLFGGIFAALLALPIALGVGLFAWLGGIFYRKLST